MFGRVRKREDHRPFVDPRHGLDDLLGEGAADRADADDGGRLDAFDGGDEVPSRRVLVGIRLLIVKEILPGRLQEAVDVEHMDLRLRVLQRHPLRGERGTQQVGKTDTGRSRAEKQILLVLELRALELCRVDHARKRDAGGALHVVIVDTVLVAVTLQQMHRVAARPILEMDAAFREHLLHRRNKFVDKGIQLRGRRARLAQAEIQWIVQVLLVVGSGIQIHRQQILRRHPGRRRVELQLADRNAHAVCAKVAEAENAAAVCHANEPDVLLRPVLKISFTLPRRAIERYMPRGWRKMWPNFRQASPIVGS